MDSNDIKEVTEYYDCLFDIDLVNIKDAAKSENYSIEKMFDEVKSVFMKEIVDLNNCLNEKDKELEKKDEELKDWRNRCIDYAEICKNYEKDSAEFMTAYMDLEKRHYKLIKERNNLFRKAKCF